MADKGTEAWYVEQLRGLWSGFPSGPRTPSENPDFLVSSQDRTVGIEVTAFTLQPEEGRQPTRELLSVRRQIVAQALTKYKAAAGPVLIVDIEFVDQVRLTKTDVDPVAEEIAQRLLSHTFLEDSSPAWYQHVPGPMPRGVAAISGGRYRFAESWDTGSGGIVRDCSTESVQEVIDKKARRYQAYRSQCDAVILLIVFSSEHDPHTEIPLAVLEHTYSSPFDTTIVLLADIPKAVALNVTPPVA